MCRRSIVLKRLGSMNEEEKSAFCAFILGAIASLASLLGPEKLTWLAGQITILASNPQLATHSSVSSAPAPPNMPGRTMPGAYNVNERSTPPAASWTNRANAGNDEPSAAASGSNSIPGGAVPFHGGYRVPRGAALRCTNICPACGGACGRGLTSNRPHHNHHHCVRCETPWYTGKA